MDGRMPDVWLLSVQMCTWICDSSSTLKLLKWIPRLPTQATALCVRHAHALSPFSHSLLSHPYSTFETPFVGYQMYFSYTPFSELNYGLQRLLSRVPWRGAIRTSAESMLGKTSCVDNVHVFTYVLLCHWARAKICVCGNHHHSNTLMKRQQEVSEFGCTCNWMYTEITRLPIRSNFPHKPPVSQDALHWLKQMCLFLNWAVIIPQANLSFCTNSATFFLHFHVLVITIVPLSFY